MEYLKLLFSVGLIIIGFGLIFVSMILRGIRFEMTDFSWRNLPSFGYSVPGKTGQMALLGVALILLGFLGMAMFS